MVKYEHHSHGTFDVGKISQFTYKAYSSLPIPYKYGNSLESICMWFKDKRDCPDFLSIAREDGKIRGWTGVYHWTDSMAYYLAWHPLVYPVDIEVGTCLVQDCIEYTKSTGRERMEVFLMNLTDEYRDYAVTCGEMYEAANMKRG
jgi:hypothetical protein